MGNVNGREGGVGGGDDPPIRANGGETVREDYAQPRSGVLSSDLMANSPPDSPRRSRSPVLFAPQVPSVHYKVIAHHLLITCSRINLRMKLNTPPEQGTPILITWSYGGKSVAVEGSWDSWRTRIICQRNPESIVEFETPLSPDSSYSQAFPGNEEYGKEPMVSPSQLNPTVGRENLDEAPHHRPHQCHSTWC